jgi:hypothetical protein
MRQWCIVVGLAVGLGGLAYAQDRPLITNQQQGYQGVVPGSANPPPRSRVGRNDTRTVITWPGFQSSGQGSRIFIQTSRPISVSESRGPSRLIYRLPNSVISTRNNRNPLVTAHFNTPVTTAFLRRAGRRDVELVIVLRAEVTPSVTNSPGENGLQFVFIDFPSGNWLPNGPPPVAEPNRIRRRSSVSLSSSEVDDPSTGMGPTP